MALPAQVNSADDIPEGLRDHYTEHEGAFVLDVEGGKTQADFDRFADAMKKRLSDALAEARGVKQNGLSRDEVTEMIRESVKALAGSGGNSDDGRTGGAGDSHAADLERRIAKLEQDKATAESERDRAVQDGNQFRMRQALSQAFAASGVANEAVPTAVEIALPLVELSESGETVTKLEAPKWAGPNLSPAELVAKMRDNPSYPFWAPPKPGGAPAGGRGGNGAGGEANPWKADSWNVTAQGNLVKQDADKAAQLAKAAGSKIGATRPPVSSQSQGAA